MAGPIITRARERFRENRPVAAAVIEGLKDAVGDPRSSVEEVDPVAVQAVTDRVAPIVANATNQEPWYQSRVKVGLIIMFAGWLAQRFGIDLGINDADRDLITNLVMAFGGSLAGVGRWINGLPPMRWNPLTWFGMRR